MRKNIAIFSDGTWQKLNPETQTNVVKLARMVELDAEASVRQVVFYDQGVGSSPWTRLRGGAFGVGINSNILRAYLFLCMNYNEGDEVYLFGFSRGAYTVRSLAGLIYCCGLLRRHQVRSVYRAMEIYRDPRIKPGHETAVRFRAAIGVRDFPDEPGRIPIKFLGCWDTVGSLGIPDLCPLIPLDRLVNRKHDFHDTVLNRKTEYAAHAVAVDEIRKPFDVAPMHLGDAKQKTQLQQRWFPGDHGSVGGGSDELAPLSDGPLLWMKGCASGEGFSGDDKPSLRFNMNVLPSEQQPDPNPLTPFDNRPKGFFRFSGRVSRTFGEVSDINQVDDSVIERLVKNHEYVPETLETIREHLQSRMDGYEKELKAEAEKKK
ncbi:MAG: DUF2235 domain-containing protein [Verrucomicrobia bacterium]|nr:DUF2235 domain-containing protein [Verrucomicrobiota bacterium]MCH8527770.1 DUF2235 domain-containing protein [Kiritimatiellia bacterium]